MRGLMMDHPLTLTQLLERAARLFPQKEIITRVVPRPGATITREAILEHLGPRVARWWLPDDVVAVESLPRTRVGKIAKRQLRERFKGHPWPAG